MTSDLAVIRTWFAAARRIVVLSGAGISTESGIPDFRGPNGLWTRDPEAEKLSDIRYYLADTEVRKRAWRSRMVNPAFTAEPNAGHRALAELERQGRLHALITQNVDGLHQKAGNSPERVIELHGDLHSAHCVSCGWRGPTLDVLERVRKGEADPPCERCGGILKTSTILFGEDLKPGVMDRAFKAAAEADLMLAVGTSLGVYPAAGVVPAAREAGARLVILNAEPTSFDSIADALLRTPIGATLPGLVA